MIFKNVSFFLLHRTLHKGKKKNPTKTLPLSLVKPRVKFHSQNGLFYMVCCLSKFPFFDMFIAGRHLNTY